MCFYGVVQVEQIVMRGQIKMLEGSQAKWLHYYNSGEKEVKPNDYSIRTLERRGSSQMITVLQIWTEGGQAKW